MSKERESVGVDRTPRTRDELTALLRERQAGWEYLLYAGSLLINQISLEDEYRDHLLRYVPLTGEPLDAAAAISRIQTAFPDAEALVAGIMHLFDPDVQKQAFGRPGEPGDEALIQALANRTMERYRELMAWGLDLRAARVPSDFRSVYQLAADMAAKPIEEIRGYVEDIVEAMDALPRRLGGQTTGPVEIVITLTLTMDDEAVQAFDDETDRLLAAGY